MESDLLRIVGESGGRSNHDTANKLLDAMMEKYDWKMFVCLVYDELTGFENHCISGYYLHVFCHAGKCAVVFHTKDGPFLNVHRIECVKGIVAHSLADYTRLGDRSVADSIKQELDSENIAWWGVACIKWYVDLWKQSLLRSQVVWEVSSRFTVCVLLK